MGFLSKIKKGVDQIGDFTGLSAKSTVHGIQKTAATLDVGSRLLAGLGIKTPGSALYGDYAVKTPAEIQAEAMAEQAEAAEEANALALEQQNRQLLFNQNQQTLAYGQESTPTKFEFGADTALEGDLALGSRRRRRSAGSGNLSTQLGVV